MEFPNLENIPKIKLNLDCILSNIYLKVFLDYYNMVEIINFGFQNGYFVGVESFL